MKLTEVNTSPVIQEQEDDEEQYAPEEVTLFDKIDALYKGKTVEEVDSVPNFYVIHRFLASDPDYALVVRDLGNKIRGDELLWQFWRVVVPRRASSPYMKYPAPGKPGDATELAERLALRKGLNRREAEQTIELFEVMGLRQELADYFGIELEDEDDS